MIDFTPVSLSNMKAYREFHDACRTRAGDYSFTNLWGWAEHYGLEWSFSGDLCWIRQTLPEVRLGARGGRWSKVDWASLLPFMRGKEFIRVPHQIRTIWQEQLSATIEVIPSRDLWD
jgi:hypothetical protein